MGPGSEIGLRCPVARSRVALKTRPDGHPRLDLVDGGEAEAPAPARTDPENLRSRLVNWLCVSRSFGVSGEDATGPTQLLKSVGKLSDGAVTHGAGGCSSWSRELVRPGVEEGADETPLLAEALGGGELDRLVVGLEALGVVDAGHGGKGEVRRVEVEDVDVLVVAARRPAVRPVVRDRDGDVVRGERPVGVRLLVAVAGPSSRRSRRARPPVRAAPAPPRPRTRR